jgi:hypothetical protein
MNEQKLTYLHRIRSQSTYPWIRRISSFVAFVFYTIAFMIFAISIVGGTLAAKGAFLFPIAIAALIVSTLFVIAGAVLKEASIMLADIADSVTDLNCRYEQ